MTNLHPGGRRGQAMTALVLVEFGTICHLCGKPGATTRDHIIPLSRGGNDSLDNCRPAHHRCNSRRGARPLTAELLAEFRPVVADVSPDPAGFFESRPPGHPAPSFLSLPESPEKTKQSRNGNENERMVS